MQVKGNVIKTINNFGPEICLNFFGCILKFNLVKKSMKLFLLATSNIVSQIFTIIWACTYIASMTHSHAVKKV